MKFQQYMKEIKAKGYTLGNDNIFRDNKKKPKCYNPVFQDLVIRQQDNDKLSEREYNLYGQLIMSLVQIVLNNVKFKFQEFDIREECRTEAYCGLLETLIGGFDRTRGSTAYSYAFRICYTNMIHVLERMNVRKDIAERLQEMYEDMQEDTGHKVNNNVDYDN